GPIGPVCLPLPFPDVALDPVGEDLDSPIVDQLSVSVGPDDDERGRHVLDDGGQACALLAESLSTLVAPVFELACEDAQLRLRRGLLCNVGQRPLERGLVSALPVANNAELRHERMPRARHEPHPPLPGRARRLQLAQPPAELCTAWV